MYEDGSYWKSLGRERSLNLLVQFRIRAHCKPNKRGVVKASENILKLWKNEQGRRLHVALVGVAGA